VRQKTEGEKAVWFMNAQLRIVGLAEKMETPTGRKVLAKQLRQSHPKEYRAVI
jgi:hypothetical protein